MTVRPAAREVFAVLAAGTAAGGAVWLVFTLAVVRARLDLCIAVGVAVAATWRLVRATVPPVRPVAAGARGAAPARRRLPRAGLPGAAAVLG